MGKLDTPSMIMEAIAWCIPLALLMIAYFRQHKKLKELERSEKARKNNLEKL
jgi:hypothetical protein